jgi:hypothetical protein
VLRERGCAALCVLFYLLPKAFSAKRAGGSSFIRAEQLRVAAALCSGKKSDCMSVFKAEALYGQ